jgi:hypothetical protein
VPGPGPWPTELRPSDEPARLRSQLVVYVVCAVAVGIAADASSARGLGVAVAGALAAGVCVCLALGRRRPLGSMPGAVAAAIAMMVLTVGLLFVGTLGGFVLVPVVGAFALGLDWKLVRRLRPLPFASGLLVVVAVPGAGSVGVAAAVAWLVLALGALASLESDRRAAQPKVEALSAGPVAPDVPAFDAATTVLVALALALVAALVLSTPSCQRSDGGGGSGRSGSGGSGLGSGAGAGAGAGQERPGGGTGSGSRPGSGTGSGSGGLYVPDPDGRFLVPNDGERRTGDPLDGIPSPELLPRIGGVPETTTGRDGTRLDAERFGDGSGRITVTGPDGETRTFTYRTRSDGLVEIRALDDQGRPSRTFLYDPKGKVATDDRGTGGSASSDAPDRPEEDAAGSTGPNWRMIGLVAVALAALGALIWWLVRRQSSAAPAPPDAPPWALRLAAEIDHQGAVRGRRRGRSEPLVRYAAELACGPLPDRRVAEVAEVVSDALFGRRDPGPEVQRTAEATWAEVLTAHPAPSRRDLRRSPVDAP